MTARQGQNSVEPIWDPDQIQTMKNYLLYKSYRDYFLFVFGINSGLRISDILNLRVMDGMRILSGLRSKKQERDGKSG